MNDYVINTPSDFNLKETLECGQCFHFNMLDENEYVDSIWTAFTYKTG